MKKFASLLLSFVMMVTFMPTMTFTAFAASQSINVTSSTSGTTTNLTTNIGETITVNLKNGGSSTLTFSGNVSPSGAATVSSSKSIAGGSTGTFTVTANKAGTITVILRSGTSSSSQKATLKITAVDPLEGFSIKAVKDSEHGLDGDVNIELSNSGAQYSGTLYLPGNADKDNVHLAWADTSVKLKTGNTTYESGKCPLASTYTVIKDDYEASLNLTIKQGSSTVKGLFLQVNEDLGTIAKMNDDTYHETSCYGGASFGGSDYFMSIKGRGNYTWKQQAKKPYNITFYKEEFTKDNIDTNSKAKVSMVDGVKTKKWSMLANYADPSLMRNKIGYDLANELGVGLGTEYYDIWMNGEYLGNYLITPKTDYEIEDSGFQLELDNKEEKGPSPDPQFWLDGIKKHGSDSYNCFTLKDIGDDALVELSGKSLEENPTPSDCVPAIQAWMQSALDAIKTTNSEEYQNYIDVESWAKVYLLNELYKNYDIVSGSIFMYRDGLTADDKLKAGPIWDLDNALGRTGICGYSGIDSTTQKSGDKWYIDSINGEDSMLQFLGMHESFMECVYRMYNDYKDSFEGAKTNLSNTKARISDSAAMDFAKYGNSRSYNNASVSSQTTVGTSPYNVVYGKTSTYENYCTNLNDFLSKRLLFLNDKLSIDAPSASVQGETENLIIYSDLDLSVPAPKTGKYTSYQWQKYDVDKAKWKNIKGETTSNYKATVDESFDGLQVRCKMLYDSGTKFSETSRVKAAELTKDVITDGVSISITMEGHEHRYLKNVIDEKYFKCDAGCDYGTTYYKSCICGESSEGKGELEATFQEDDAKGHVFEKTEAVLANFTDSGNLEYYTCQREDCGRYFLDEEGKNEIEENQWIVPAIDKDSVSIDDSKCVYDGNAQKPVFEIKDVEGTSLVEDKDYTLSYSDNVDAGQATLKVQFIGNYEGELEESFTVSPKHIDISEADIKIASTSEFNYDYTGLPLEPEAVLVGYPEDWYEVVYENNINAGDDALVKARFVGNYEGEATKAFTINRIPLPKIRSIRPAVIAYDGTPKEPHVIIDAPADGKPLVRGVDFVATYSNNVEIGVGTVVVEGIGNFYGGYYEKKFDIGIRTLPGTLTLESPADFDYHYDGTAKEPKVIVTDSEEGRQLVEGEDYTVTYSGEHTEPGEVIVTVEGIRGYKGTRTLKFQIKKAQLPKIEDLECVEYTYDGTAKTPGFELVGPAGKLQEGVDYSVEYKANTNAGIAKVIATAIDGSPYVGSSERTFSIYHKEFEADIEMPSDFDYGYTGHEIKPEPIVNSKDKNATYDFVYKKNVEIGTAFVTVAASGNYKGSYIKNFKIVKGHLDQIKLAKTAYVYDGQAIEAEAEVYNKAGDLLTANVDYTLSYQNNDKVGDAKVVATGIGKYSGEISKTFIITDDKTAGEVLECSVKNKVMSIGLTADSAKEALDNIVEGTTETVLIKALGEGTVTKLQLSVSNEVLATVKEKNVALKIASPMGDIYLDHASITEICGKLGDKDLQFDLNKKSSSSSENAYSLEFKKSGTSDTFVLNSSKVELTLPLPKDAVSSPAATRKSGNFTYKIDGKDAEFDKESKLAKLKLDQTKEFSVLSNKAAEKQIRASIKLSTVKLNKVSASSDGKIKLTISKGDGNTPTYYYVYRSTKKSSGYKKIGSVKYLSKDTYTYTNSTNLKKGTKYYYKVRGYYKSDGVVVYTKYSTVKYATCKKTRK